MSKRQMLVAEFEREAVSTKKMLESVPDDFSRAPHEESINLEVLATHIALLLALVKPVLRRRVRFWRQTVTKRHFGLTIYL